ncbi:hypothetical protein [Phocoenobacter atlanticus]|uniref:hypothetical protein n=1 Tax=Phocoenobacter atlanticus TaxID=3416742 RepID=UPI002771ECCD|nr:hypothetical protein [Pasteurella atlantica]MDP8101464.1 hypothetical protein [Pasteurella atlantica]
MKRWRTLKNDILVELGNIKSYGVKPCYNWIIAVSINLKGIKRGIINISILSYFEIIIDQNEHAFKPSLFLERLVSFLSPN